MRKVAIIGAGAAGMTAAITAASNGAEVVVLEHMDRVGKKILSTGNGRCNFTNTYQDRSCYHSDNESFPCRADYKIVRRTRRLCEKQKWIHVSLFGSGIVCN